MSTSLKAYYEMRLKRLALQAQVNVMEQDEKDLLYSITKEMTSMGSLQMEQAGFRANREIRVSPLVTDWPGLLAYVKSSGSVDLLQKRLTESAVKLRWDDGIELPGVTRSEKNIITVITV